MAKQDTLWKLEPHSIGKHLVLRGYLNAWFPILGQTRDRILFIDGFAGPGEYLGGEEGSPLIAIRAYDEHSAKKNIQAEIRYIFIEENKVFFEHLHGLLEERESCLSPNCHIDVIRGKFDETMTDVLSALEAQRKNLAPAFVMIDPFGVSGTPMRLVERILSNPQAEVYVTLMYEFINRFKITSEFEVHLDSLFGTGEWRKALSIRDSVARKNFIFQLYEQQLRKSGARYVVNFELYEGNRLVYAIFFGTQNIIGCEKMKQAIWRIAPWGDFAFHGTKSQQLTLDMAAPDLEPLKEQLKSRFKDSRWVTIEEIMNFVASDQTDYLVSHLKRDTLRPMEDAGEIEVDANTRQKRRTYPPGTRLRFTSKSEAPW